MRRRETNAAQPISIMQGERKRCQPSAAYLQEIFIIPGRSLLLFFLHDAPAVCVEERCQIVDITLEGAPDVRFSHRDTGLGRIK